jgi:hypothetical protein
MSIFEIIMLICFGAAWPFSIYKSYNSRANAGKSIIFLYVVFIGYMAGITHKFYHAMDYVIWLYALNASMVLIDILLYYRNRELQKNQ